MKPRNDSWRGKKGRASAPVPWVAAVVACAWLSGCAQVHMKGTPFYTGEYAKPQGPAEDRVNLWPLAYYHDPALSILWPIGEKTEEHFAIRPFYSVYKLDKDEHEYNVLWPLNQFDYDTGDFRITPFFWGGGGSWGDKYFTAFPLVWLTGSPAEFTHLTVFPLYWQGLPGGHTVVFPIFWYYPDKALVVFPMFWSFPNEAFAVFPLYIQFTSGEQGSYHVLWPIFNYMSGPQEKGWRVWPFFGHYDDKDRRYSFVLWPLIHNYVTSAGETTRAAAPFYFTWFKEDQGWELLLPLYGRSWETGKSGFYSLLFSQGSSGENFWRLAFPLFYQEKADSAEVLLTPLFGYSRDGEDSLLITPLYSAGHKGDFLWRLILPLYYGSEEGKDLTWITPLAGGWRRGDARTWLIPPLLSIYRSEPVVDHGSPSAPLLINHYFWLLFPLVHSARNGEAVSHHVVPFYYYSREGEKRTFLSLPYSTVDTPSGSGQYILGPVFIHQTSPGSGRSESGLFYPLSGWSADKDGGDFWLWPLFERAYSNAESARAHGWLLWPLVHYDLGGERDRYLTILPFFTWSSRQERPAGTGGEPAAASSFYCLPSFWRERSTAPAQPPGSGAMEKFSSGLFPLWHHKVQDNLEPGKKQEDFSVLGWLYDYRHLEEPKEKAEGRADYVRSRVLWRLVHYERLNEDTSLDVFPFVTWDRKPGPDFKKVSFGWRLFRYERDGANSLKVDFLFLPIVRSKRVQEPAAAAPLPAP